MKLIFASGNRHKIEEIRSYLGNSLQVESMEEAGITEDIPEPFASIEENAYAKAWRIFQLTGKDCFSEDTGLEVEILNNEPGVKSARYAGEEKSFQKNIEKLLGNLNGRENRKARFKAVISLILEGRETRFEGICNGKIIDMPRGTGGFGYDPVFVPEGDTRSFAEMSMAEKSPYNHRIKAIKKMVAYLQDLKKIPD